MRRLPVALMLAAALFVWGCSSGMNADELFNTATLEERQDNKEHALELYKELIKKFPKSQYARRANIRIGALEAEKLRKFPEAQKPSRRPSNRP